MYSEEWRHFLTQHGIKESSINGAGKRSQSQLLSDQSSNSNSSHKKQCTDDASQKQDAQQLPPVLNITPIQNVQDLPLPSSAGGYSFRHTRPNSRLLQEQNFKVLTGCAVEIISSSNGAEGSRFSYFSGEATLWLRLASGGCLRVRCSSWPLVDSYVQMTVRASRQSERSGATYLALDMSYRPRRITRELLQQLLDELNVEAYCVARTAMLQEFAGCKDGAMSREQCAKMLLVHGYLRLAMEHTRLFVLGISICLADCYGQRGLAGKWSSERLLLIWHILKQLGKPETLCFPHLYRNPQKNMKLPRLSLTGLKHLLHELQLSLSEEHSPDSLYPLIQFYHDVILDGWVKAGHSFIPKLQPDSQGRRYSVLPSQGRVSSLELQERLVGAPFYALIHMPVQAGFVQTDSDVASVCTLIQTKRVQEADALAGYRWKGELFFVPEAHSSCIRARDCIERLLQHPLKRGLTPGVNEDAFIGRVKADMASDGGKQLHPLQEKALRCLFHKRILCVTGKGGTGKSSVFIRYLKQLRDEVWKRSVVDPYYAGSAVMAELRCCLREMRKAGSLPRPARERLLERAAELLSQQSSHGYREEEILLRLDCMRPKSTETQSVRAEFAVLQKLVATAVANLRSKSAVRHLCITAPTSMAATNLHSFTDGMGDTMDMITTCVKYKPRSVYTASIKTLVVEEASCCDEERIARLLECFPNLQQLIFIFDNNQIGPVGGGFVSRDFYDLLQSQDAVVTFKMNYRAVGVDSQRDGAKALLTGYKAILKRQPRLLDSCSTILPEEVMRQPVEQIVSSGVLLNTGSFVLVHSSEENELGVVAKLYCALSAHGKDVQVISFRNAVCNALNRCCFSMYYGVEPKTNVYMRRQRVVFTRNYYPEKKQKLQKARKRGQPQRKRQQTLKHYGGAEPRVDNTGGRHCQSFRVSNGEVWDIQNIVPCTAAGRHCYFRADGQRVSLNSTKEVELADLTRLEARVNDQLKWVYMEDIEWKNMRSGMAITGNKSQGKQYGFIIVVVPAQSSRNLTLNTLYTMVGRCQLCVFIVTDLRRHDYRYGELEHVILKQPRVFRFGGIYRMLSSLDLSSLHVP